MSPDAFEPGRRRLLRALFVAPVLFAAGIRLPWPDAIAAAEDAAGSPPGAGRPGALDPTPDCGDDDEPTPPATQGPFFKPRSPLRTSLLEPGVAGATMLLQGRVFGRDCRPLSRVLLDFWQADGDGEYDNAGFRLRGHQFTDEAGRYRLETVLPGLYPGRTRHIHVRVQAAGSRILTTQLFFPGEPRNRNDFIFRPELVVAMNRDPSPRKATFHFVLDAA
ncbi:MAG TPA: dioxygenase [Candidatus Eisenbacteria bacterium]|jgi:hypothetical protein